MIRLLDIVFSLFGLLVFLPLFLVIYIVIRLESAGDGFYTQSRVGINNVDFNLLKFRTMRTGSDKKGLLTVGGRDPRITRFGYYIRKFKFDELPQLYNVLIGDMSLVGPRPEVRRYVDVYTEDQKKVLSVRPGITDYASVEFINENEIVGAAKDPEKAYIEQVLPEKIKLNMKYIENKTISQYIYIIFLTFFKIFKN